MSKIYLHLLLLQIICTIGQAATVDSLVYFSDLNFRDQLEREVFCNLKKAHYEDEMLSLLLYIKPYEDSIPIAHSEKLLNNFIEQHFSQINNIDEEARVKLIVGLVNKTFLKKHKTNSYFQETIATGAYNCYTSAALYSILLSKLNIPYQIKENINGISLITYPTEKKIPITIETPEKKCVEYTAHFRNTWTKSMFYVKIIPMAEFEKGYSEALFEKYYFKNLTLSLPQLASILFCNLSIQASDESNVQEAVYHMQKSYFLDANERNQATLKYHIFNALGKYNYENNNDFDKLIYLCRYRKIKDIETSSDLISSEFLRFVTQQIKLKIGLPEIEKQYLTMMNNSNDSLLLRALTYAYNNKIAEAIINLKTYEVDAFNYLHNAYKVKPDDQTLKSLIFASLNEKINKTKDAAIVLKIVNEYCSKFDFLDVSISTKTIKINCYLNFASNNFMNGLPLEGEENLKKSEQLCTQYGIKPSFESAENSYLSAAKYYYKKGDKLKAKEYLLKGFEYAPDSKLIQDKLKLVK
jgi:hypothetical protein